MQLSWYSGDTCKHVSTQTPCSSVGTLVTPTNTPCSSVGTLATPTNMSALRHHAAQLVLWRHLQTCQHSDTMQLSWYSGDTYKHTMQLSWYSGDTYKHVSTQTPCSSVGTLATPANMSALRHHAAQLVLWRHLQTHHAAQLVLWRHLQTCQHSDTMQLSWYSGDTCKHVSTQTPSRSVGTLATPANMSALRHHAAQLVLWRHLQTCQHSDTKQISWYSGDTCKHVSTQTPCSSVGTLVTPANMSALRHQADQLVLW